MSTAMSVDIAVDTRSTLGRYSVYSRWRFRSADTAFQVTDTSPTLGQLSKSFLGLFHLFRRKSPRAKFAFSLKFRNIRVRSINALSSVA